MFLKEQFHRLLVFCKTQQKSAIKRLIQLQLDWHDAKRHMLPGSYFRLSNIDFEQLIIWKERVSTVTEITLLCCFLRYLRAMFGMRCSCQQSTEAITEVYL